MAGGGARVVPCSSSSSCRARHEKRAEKEYATGAHAYTRIDGGRIALSVCKYRIVARR